MSAISSAVAVFHRGTKQYGVDECTYETVSASGQISDNGPIRFQLNGKGSKYVLLPKCRVHVKARVTNTDGTALPADSKVAFTNLSLHSCFRQVDVSLNQQVVSPDTGTNYPYKAILDIYLTSGQEDSSQVQSEGFYKDQRYAMDSLTANAGALKRKALANQGIVDFEGVLHVDAAQQDRAILNNVEIAVKLFQHDDSFRLMGDKAYKLTIEDAELIVCYLSLNPSMIVVHNERLSKGPALYPYLKSSVKAFAIAKGSHTWAMDDIFHGFVPSKLIVAFVSSAAYSGDFTKNPFNFHHFDLNYLEFSKDGRSIPASPFQPKFTANTAAAGQYLDTGYIREFLSLFKNEYPQLNSTFIEREDFPGGKLIHIICCVVLLFL